MSSYRQINIFVSHPFVPDNPMYDLEKFRSNISLLIQRAESEVRKEHGDFDIETIYQFTDFQQGLPQQIESSIRKSHFAIVDLTENKPNIFFEYGLMRGLHLPVLLTKAKDSFVGFDVPADLKDQIVIDYTDFEDLSRKCFPHVVRLFKELLSSDSLYNVYLNKLWFSDSINAASVITSSEAETREFAELESENYMLLESFGDKDALLEVMTFLNRTYRKVKISMYPADKFTGEHEDNLVVIGGPGEAEGDSNNMCKIMMDQVKAKVCYSEDCECLIYKGHEFRATKRGNLITKDYGYFARFPNPFNPSSSVVLINGIHTFGVLGAAKVFSDHPAAQGNIKKLLTKLKLDDTRQAAFECFFEVDIIQHKVICPIIDENQILPL